MDFFALIAEQKGTGLPAFPVAVSCWQAGCDNLATETDNDGPVCEAHWAVWRAEL